MKSISRNIDNKHIITYIKQILLDRGASIEDLAKLEFDFIDTDKDYLQCLINGENQAILNYNDYHCHLSNINGSSISLSKSWHDFMLACVSGKSTNDYFVINLKDCIASYMIECDTNIASKSEIQNYANYLQSSFTNRGKKVIVLADEISDKKFKNEKDELLVPTNVGYYLNDGKELIDLNDYIFNSIDDDIFEDFMHSQSRFLEDKNVSM